MKDIKSPLITMSSVTGNPSYEDVNSYLTKLKDAGIDCAMIYPRSGCEVKYLSDDWFEIAGYFIDCAKKLDMDIWIYDEFNWPSGDAGGIVTANPDFRLRSICTSGDDFGKISTFSRHNKDVFGEKYFPDLLSSEAVAYFIQNTHEQYYRRFGDDFGKVIKGFFTDEPSVGYCCTETSIPYYEGMDKDYTALCGNNFYSDMRVSSPEFYERAMKLVANRFEKCFSGQIADWCRKHNVEMCGHLMSDSHPFDGVKSSGNVLQMLKSFTVPGVDELHASVNDSTTIGLLGLLDYAQSGHGAMAEFFALCPPDTSFARKRITIFLAACFKVDKIFLAVAHMDMRGNTKITDYYNEFSATQPNIKGMRLLSQQAKLACEYAHKDFTPDVYIEFPTDVCARHSLTGVDIWQVFRLVKAFTNHQLQWRYTDKNDNLSGVPIVKFDDDMQYVYENVTYTDAEDVCKCFDNKPLLTCTDGSLPELGVFVRRYNTGEFLILNLKETSSTYLIDGKKVTLAPYDVVTDKTIKEDAQAESVVVDAVFDVDYGNDNITRCMYVNDEKECLVVCEDDVELKIAVRNDRVAKLCDDVVTADVSMPALPDGMKKLYSASKNIKLKAGTYRVCSGDDHKYLPTVLLVGDFCAASSTENGYSVTLSPRKRTLPAGEFIRDFGTVTLTATVKIPDNAKQLELVGAQLYTQLYVNDALVGEKIQIPYTFDLDHALCGKTVKLSIKQSTSVAPLFGDVEYWHKTSNNVVWKNLRSPIPEPFGTEQIKFII